MGFRCKHCKKEYLINILNDRGICVECLVGDIGNKRATRNLYRPKRPHVDWRDFKW